MQSTEDKILNLLLTKPNQKASEIAKALDIDRGEINKFLYGSLKSKVKQNKFYQWSLATENEKKNFSKAEEKNIINTKLSKICRYYMSCLGNEDIGISTFLTSKYGEPDYIEVSSLPFDEDHLKDSQEVRNIYGRKRTEQGRYEIYFGYPTNISHVKSKKSDWEGFMVEPIFLFPVTYDKLSKEIKINLQFPIVNQKPFKKFSNAEQDNLINEIVQFENELNLNNTEEIIAIDELSMRLQAIRPEWPWKEIIEPLENSKERIPLSEINEAGIYNRALLIMAERSPFTQGLENELRELATLDESNYEDSALGKFINNNFAQSKKISVEKPLLEVLPMNVEQRQAVKSALSQPLTVITGPPGTGKSQVVTNILINAAWNGKRVLFASKNNKAVDVVETRVNSLGPRPILLRVGSQSNQLSISEHILSLLSNLTSKTDIENFKFLEKEYLKFLEKHENLLKKSQRLIDLRNELDSIEQKIEIFRIDLGSEIFNKLRTVSVPDFEIVLKETFNSINRANKSKNNFLNRMVWPFIRKRRLVALVENIKKLNSELSTISQKLSSDFETNFDFENLYKEFQRIISLIDGIKNCQTYFAKLNELKNLQSIESISKEELSLLKGISKLSEDIWQLWLKLQSSRIEQKDRENLAKYSTLLKMITDQKSGVEPSDTLYKKYNAMLREISHLLPCWAVTSLSARGRIPFQSNIFDIVIFDEASQCDIASALPLLYRAKSVVIIGDPKQLQHISNLKRGVDHKLLEKNELLEDFPHWSYSYQSLFGLSATYVSGDDVINLVDHHRSHFDIINFSNKEFYDESLRVATKYNNLKSINSSEPGIRWVDIIGNTVRPLTGGAINLPEIKEVIKILRDLAITKNYKGSIGFVTPFRSQVSALIGEINNDLELSNALISRDFLADTVHKFQGDERDVMIFSPVISRGTPETAIRFLKNNGNLFNVAITRARAQLIVIGDMSYCRQCEVGYLSRFADYTNQLKLKEDIFSIESQIAFTRNYPNTSGPFVSDWEKLFYVSAFDAGLRLIPQYKVEKYYADFVLIVGERRLAIEIDGEMYHRNWTGELCRRDQIRNQRFFELGYDVIRFWVYEVRDDIEGCLNRIQKWISAGIIIN